MADFAETRYEVYDRKTAGYFKTKRHAKPDTHSPGTAPSKSTLVMGGGWAYDPAEEARVRAGAQPPPELGPRSGYKKGAGWKSGGPHAPMPDSASTRCGTSPTRKPPANVMEKLGAFNDAVQRERAAAMKTPPTAVTRRQQQEEEAEEQMDPLGMLAVSAENVALKAEVERLTRELEGLRHESSSAATGGSAQR